MYVVYFIDPTLLLLTKTFDVFHTLHDYIYFRNSDSYPMSNDISYITNLCNNKFCMDIYSNVSLWKVVRPPKMAGNSSV